MNVIKHLEELKQDIVNLYIVKNVKASGNFAQNIEIRQVADKRWQVIAPYYVWYFEKGKSPGKVPNGFASIIYKWSMDKGITFTNDKQRARFAFLTAKKIQKEGTKAFRTKEREGQIYTQPIEQATQNIKKEVIRELTNTVNVIFKEFNKL